MRGEMRADIGGMRDESGELKEARRGSGRGRESDNNGARRCERGDEVGEMRDNQGGTRTFICGITEEI